METLVQDLRQALRGLGRRPGFTALAVIVVALGIGTVTAMFSVLDTLLIRALPYEGADRIVTIWEENAESGIERDDVAPGNFLDWREQARSFEQIAALAPSSLDLTGNERPEVLFGASVTEGFFRTLGTRPLLGRTFRAEDFLPGSGKVVVLNHSLWQRRFGADPGLIGKALQLDGEPHTVIGILPDSFDPHLLPAARDREAWVPLVLEGWEEEMRESRWWNAVGRLRPGVSLTEARAEMDTISTRLARDFPDTNQGIRVNLVPLREHLAGHARTALLVLQGAVGLLLAIACANLAGLFLARGTERQGELAIRAALGAGRRRLVRQLLAENVVIAFLGGVVGLVLAYWMVGLITTLAPAAIPRLNEVRVDGRTLLFSLALAGFTALVAGIMPSFRLSRPDVRGALKQQRTASTGGADRRLRAGIVVAEIALSVVLLVGAGLLARSFVRLLGVDPGFDRDKVAAIQVFRNREGETPQQRREFFRQAVERIEALAGVRSAAAVSALPFIESNVSPQLSFVVQGRPEPRKGEAPNTFVSMATPDYFQTLGIPLLEGRGIEPTDHEGAPRVAVVSEALRRRHWPNESPVGKQIRFLGESTEDYLEDPTRWVEIVGVVGQVRHEGLDREPRPEVFLPHAQTSMGAMTFVARTEGDAAALLEPMQKEIWALDSLQTVYRAATLRELVAKSVATRRFSLWLLGTFAAVALILAAIGLYGVVSYSTRTRFHEFGVRMALGANRADIFQLVLRQGAIMTLGGLALGLAGALAMTKTLATLLYEVAPWDGWTFAASASVLAAVALLASYIPARRATRVDQVEALRQE
jgi:putative ABC transport system permease protein